MVKFLITTGVSHHLEQMIKNAKEKVVLISPFLKVNDKIKELLEYKNRLKIDVRIIYGKSELQPDEVTWLNELDYIRSSYCKNLHAKCYLNEKEAIVTSMNLYEFSQVNNNEMGIYVNKLDDPKLYTDIAEEVQRLILISKDKKISVDKVTPIEKLTVTKQKSIERTIEAPKSGFCIRCKKIIIPNPLVPYCNICYKTWKQFKNEKYEEEYCHICGKSNKSSKIKPVCMSCYKKYNGVIDFP